MKHTRTGDSARTSRQRLALALARHRRLVAAVLVAVGVWTAIGAARPMPEQTVTVLVASSDLSAGRALTSADVRSVQIPPSAVPSHALTSSNAVVGRVLAGPMRAGEILTDRRVVGASLMAGFPAGTVAAPVRIADTSTVSVLRVGDRVNVYAATDGPASRGPIVSRATVVALPQSSETSSGEGQLVVLAVSSHQASDLTDAAATTALSLALLPQ